MSEFKRLTEEDVLKMENPIEAWIEIEAAYAEIDRLHISCLQMAHALSSIEIEKSQQRLGPNND
jgi:hypothetical protein